MKYEIDATVTISGLLTVEASSPSEAKQIAREKLSAVEEADYDLEDPTVKYAFELDETVEELDEWSGFDVEDEDEDYYKSDEDEDENY